MSATRPAPQRRGSLRIKIIAWSLGPAVIVLTAVALVSYLAYQQVTADLVIDRDRELARLTASELAAELGEYPGLLEAAARDLAASENALAAPLAGLAEIRHRLVYFDGGTVLLNNLGRVMAAEPLRPEILGVDWSTRPYFRALIQRTGQPAFSDIVPEGPGGARVIALAVPVLNHQGEFLGALVGMFRVSADAVNPFYGTLLRLRLERKGTAYVIDGQGQVIYASDPGQIGADLAGHPVTGQALAGQIGAVRIRALDGREALASYGPVPDTAWSLIIEEDWAELTRVIRGYGRALLTLLAMGVVIPAAVVLVGARRITGPIAALVQAARQVASGHFGQTVAANTGDELEVLADQFNRMSAELKHSYGQLEQRVDERTRQLSTLLRISRDVTSTLELEPLLGQILDQLKTVVDYGGAGILVLEAGRLRFRAYRGMTDPELVFNLQFPLAESFAGQVLAAGQPMIVADMQANSPQSAAIPPASRQRLRMVFHNLRSMLAVPLLVKEQSTGLLILFHDQARYFSTADAELTAAFAAQSAVAIENARLFEARQRRAEQLGVINEVGRRITSILDVRELLNQTARLTREAFGYYHVHIGLVENGVLAFKTLDAGPPGDPQYALCESVRPRVGVEGVTGWAAATGEPVLVQDTRLDPRFIPAGDDPTRAELVMPIRVKGDVIGVLSFESDRTDAFDDSDLAVAEALASQVAVAIENARLYGQARQLAALEERQKLARELHDSVSQALYGIALGARSARTLLDREPAAMAARAFLADPLDYVLSLAQAGLAEMRALIFELRPESLQSEGLVAALAKQADSARARHRLEVDTTFAPEPDIPLEAKEALYRIGQEALHNIAKHARARRVELCLRLEGGTLRLEIGDDGIGFDPRDEFPGHLGLRSMRERIEALGGSFAVESAPGAGTRVRVGLPM